MIPRADNQRPIRVFISVFSAVCAFLPFFTRAALTYSRSPAGSLISNPITITISAGSVEDLAIGENLYWGLYIGQWPDNSVGAFSECVPRTTLSYSFVFNLPAHDYSEVDVMADNTPAQCANNNANIAYNQEGDGGAAIFTVPGPPTKGTGGSAAPVQYRPEVNILSPSASSVFGAKAELKYKAKDQNDELGLATDRFGLDINSVSIYYADSIDFEQGKLVAEEDKKLIAKGLPNEGVYAWDTKNIPEGPNYRIIIDAKDRYGELGESVSTVFSIDHSSPVFNVKTDPAVSKGEDVRIIIDSSKDLAAQPKVKVKQRGYVETDALVFAEPRDQTRHFEGTYRVISGYDGPAIISVSGEDMTGNKGNLIVSGGIFSIGIEPPPKPLIFSPLDKDVFATSTIEIRGRAREDTEVLLTVNGKGELKTRPDKNGNFVFENVKLDPEANYGVNFISVSSRDSAGSISEASSLSVKFNILPTVSILSPKTGEILSASTTIKIAALDSNNDKLIFDYEVGNGLTWTLLASGASRRHYLWNTYDFPDGEYLVRVSVSDGISKIYATSGPFTLKNFLPTISFSDGQKSVSNKKDNIIEGRVESPEKVGKKETISDLEYSLDNKAWTNVGALDGAFNSPDEKFSLSLNDLKEDVYKISFRAKDARGFYGRAAKILIVDFGPPSTPSVQFSRLRQDFGGQAIISDEDDLDKNTAGAQFVISGNAEPESKVLASLNDKLFSAKADKDGAFKILATLREHGQNNFKVFAEDAAGNKSTEADAPFIYNNAPSLESLRPRDGGGLNHKTKIEWEAADLDGDDIQNLALSYRKGGGEFRQLLTWRPSRQVAAQPPNSFAWDVSGFPAGGDYELKLEADDGTSSRAEIIKIFIDNTPPEITFEPLAETSFKKAFTLRASGSARDDFSGIAFVEYSIGGASWFKAIITKGFRGREAEFRFSHPFKLEDGIYKVSARSIDVAGNVSEPKFQEIIVDTTPPRVGSFTISKGAIILLPEGEIFKISTGAKLKFLISLEKDTVKAHLAVEPPSGGSTAKWIDLLKNKSTGLWEGELEFNEQGRHSLSISAEDALGNKIENKKIGDFEIIKQGKTEPGSKITVYIFDEEDGSWKAWNGEEYGEVNPIESGSSGGYDLLLPAGKYQILVKKSGFQRLRTSELIVINPKFIDFDLSLIPRSGLRGFIENLLDKFYD